jgi:hypothetical protein
MVYHHHLDLMLMAYATIFILVSMVISLTISLSLALQLSKPPSPPSSFGQVDHLIKVLHSSTLAPMFINTSLFSFLLHQINITHLPWHAHALLHVVNANLFNFEFK